MQIPSYAKIDTCRRHGAFSANKEGCPMCYHKPPGAQRSSPASVSEAQKCTIVPKKHPKAHENHAKPQIPDPEHPEQAGTLEGNGKGEAQSPGRPHVRFTLCRCRLLDVDAKYGSIKDLLDGLQYAGLIHGDREDEITLEVWQEKVAHRSDEKTIIEIDGVENNGK